MSSYNIIKDSLCTNLLDYYYKIRPKAIAGLDKIDKYKFDEIKDKEFEIIEKKVLNGEYHFTRYKKILINKGENKYPRVINIPTIRDKIVLAVLNDCLNKIYNKKNCSQLPHLIIDDIKSEVDSNKYDYFIKYDIKTFYTSINHDILMRKIRYKIRNKNILHLISSAITNDGLIFPIKKSFKKEKRIRGVPEGLSISNSLANIYLMSLDKKMKSIPKIKYFRYVDDIIILCNKNIKYDIDLIIKKEVSYKLKLEFNKKCIQGSLSENGFEYLGYYFKNQLLSVRESSRLKLENSIESLLSKYKFAETKNEELLLWKINLKISGCIYKNKKYGWIFFYSQINDMKLLAQLDWFVLKLLKRQKINIKPKKFKKTYYEIRNNLHNTKYIIKLDDYTFEDKKYLLEKIYKRNIGNLDEKQINDIFENIIFKDIASLEEDIQHFS